MPPSGTRESTPSIEHRTETKVTNRRRFLQATGIAGLAGIAGCLGDDDNGDDTDDDGNGNGAADTEPDPDEEYEPVDELDFVGISSDISTIRAEAQSLVADDLEELGLDIDLTPGGWGPLGEAFENMDYDLLTLWWVGRAPRLDPHFMIHQDLHGESGANYVGYANDQYDAAVDASYEEYDFDQRREHVHEALEHIANDQPMLFLFHLDVLASANEATFSNWNPKIGAQTYWNLPNIRSLTPEGGEDTVVYGTTVDINTVNPLGSEIGDRNIQQQKIFHEQLTQFNEDGENVLRAASDVEYVDDTTVEVEIRDDLVFHDGESLDASDVAFAYQYIIEHGPPYYGTYTDPIESVEQTDDYTVEFTLEHPFAPLEYVTFSQIPIIPEHVWDGMLEEEGIDLPEEWDDVDHTGAGPFEIVDFSPGERVMYEVHDDHPWADEFDFDTLIWQIYGSEAAAFGDLEGGQASFMQEIQFTNFERAEADENLQAYNAPGIGATAIWTNMEREPFNDIMFRRAMAHVVDQQHILNLVNQGLGEVAQTPISPANETWYNEDIPTYDGGIEEAETILSEAGYRWDDDGTLLKPLSRFEGDGPPRYSHEL